jgi:CRP-like cAMP-binding protein
MNSGVVTREEIDMNVWARTHEGTGIASPAHVLNPDPAREIAHADSAGAKHEVEEVLRGLGTIVEYAKGSRIFAEGGNANVVYRVMSGAVTLWRKLPNGKRHIVDFRLAGEYFGVIHRPTYALNAEAASDSVVSAYRRGQVDGICDEVPSFRRAIEILLTEPVMSRSEIAAAEWHTAKERIADLLLKASRRAAQGGEPTVPLSDRDIGDCIDAPPELVAHSLGDFESAGAIMRTPDGGLVVTNPAVLSSAL